MNPVRDIDLGDGHVATLMRDPDTEAVIGIFESHADYDPQVHGCSDGGYVAWAGNVKHTGHNLVSVDPLHVEPSLFHRHLHSGSCPEGCKENSSTPQYCHGFIRQGRWIPA